LLGSAVSQDQFRSRLMRGLIVPSDRAAEVIIEKTSAVSCIHTLPVGGAPYAVVFIGLSNRSSFSDSNFALDSLWNPVKDSAWRTMGTPTLRNYRSFLSAPIRRTMSRAIMFCPWRRPSSRGIRSCDTGAGSAQLGANVWSSSTAGIPPGWPWRRGWRESISADTY
jgi:hypothetical protein